MKGGFYGLAAKTFLSVTNTQLWCIAAANSRLLNDKNNTDLSTDHYLSNAEIRTQAQKLAGDLLLISSILLFSVYFIHFVFFDLL